MHKPSSKSCCPCQTPAQPILDHFTHAETLSHSLVHLIQQKCQTFVSLRADAETYIEGKMLNFSYLDT